jgi:F0F1-type ATP synthase delta subunit
MKKKSLRNFARSIVETLHEETPAQVETAMKDVVGLMKERGLLSRWRELEKELHTAWKEKFGVSKVTVVSTHPMMQKTYKILEELAPGAEMIERIDDRLMGGAIIRMDDRRIDGTILGSLQRLKNTLLDS